MPAPLVQADGEQRVDVLRTGIAAGAGQTQFAAAGPAGFGRRRVLRQHRKGNKQARGKRGPNTLSKHQTTRGIEERAIY